MALITPKSLEDFKNIQLEKFKQLIPNINTNSDSMVSIDATVIAEVAYLLQQDLITQTNNSFIAYATGDELSNLGADRGIPRKDASKSYGYATFSREEKAPANYSVLAGTTISTEEDSTGNVLAFKTTEDGTIYGIIDEPKGITFSLGSSGNISDGTYSYTITALSGDGRETHQSLMTDVVINNGNSDNNIVLGWGAVSRSEGYNVYLGGVLLGTTITNSFNDTIGSTLSLITPPTENQTGNTEVTLPIESQGNGSIYNSGIGSIVKLIETPVGVEKVENKLATIGGANTETDDVFRIRLKESLISNSGKTTASGYENTALTVSGVGTATAIHETGKPANEISVFITSSDISNPTPSTELLELVTLELNKDENRAVCDTIVAKAAIVIPQNIEVNISEYDTTNYTEEAITSAISENLVALMKTIPTEGILRLVSIGNTIHDTPGVIDYSLVTPTSNYTTGPNETVSLGVLTINYI